GCVGWAAGGGGAVGARVGGGGGGWVRGTARADEEAAREPARRGITTGQVWAGRAAGYPAGRVLSPAEVAGVVSFLASDAAAGISGEAITVALGGTWELRY